MSPSFEIFTLVIAAAALILSVYQEIRHGREQKPFVEMSLFRRDQKYVGIRITGRNPSRGGVVVGPAVIRRPTGARFEDGFHGSDKLGGSTRGDLLKLEPGDDDETVVWVSPPGGAEYGGTIKLCVSVQPLRQRHFRVTSKIRVVPFIKSSA